MARSLLVHLTWSGLVVAGAALLIGAELSAPCPPGGPLSFGQCSWRPLTSRVLGLGVVLYVAGLSGVLLWLRGLRRRRLGDPAGARQWYLIAAVIGAPIALLLAFTLVSALR